MNYKPYNSIRKKVLDYFRVNRDEELSASDIAEKFACITATQANERLKKIVQMGLLSSTRKNRMLHYSVGSQFEKWVNTPEPPPPPVKTAPIRIRLTVVVHSAGTSRQRIEVKL